MCYAHASLPQKWFLMLIHVIKVYTHEFQTILQTLPLSLSLVTFVLLCFQNIFFILKNRRRINENATALTTLWYRQWCVSVYMIGFLFIIRGFTSIISRYSRYVNQMNPEYIFLKNNIIPRTFIWGNNQPGPVLRLGLYADKTGGGGCYRSSSN